METKILASIKKQLGIGNDVTQFDDQVTMGINMAISALTQIGIGPASGFSLESGNETWEQFVEDKTILKLVKGYIHCKTKIFFDPPANQTLLSALEKNASECEWRLRVEQETLEGGVPDEG